MRHVAGRYMLASRFHIGRRIIKEDVRAECIQEWAFVAAAEKERFIDSHTPTTQG